MKFVAVLAVVAGLASAGAAAAQDQISDQAFLQANRCKGLASGLGADPAPFKAYLKNQARSRADMIVFKAQAEAGQAVREAANPANREKLNAELSGPCSAYAPAMAVAGGGGSRSTKGAN
jgi:hypothetical protein